MLVLVKNLQNTALRSPNGYDSWKDYWMAKAGKNWPYYCPVPGCSERAEVGAHVKLANSYSNKWYIVPLCYKHNNNHDATFYVDSEMLVPVND